MRRIETSAGAIDRATDCHEDQKVNVTDGAISSYQVNMLITFILDDQDIA